MNNIQYVKRKIEQSYLIWFKNSNLYYQFEEPVWFVFNRLEKKLKTGQIVRELQNEYEIEDKEALDFVLNVQVKIDEINGSDNTLKSPFNFEDYKRDNYNAHVNHVYRLGNSTINFAFETDWLAEYIHPLIEHLKIDDPGTSFEKFELYTSDDMVVFQLNGEIIGVWTDEESNYVKGKIFMKLLNVLHNKTDKEWLMTVHASAVSNGKKAILFSAPPGSGKTTIAALCKAVGYHLLSDDFVPIDKKTFYAYPFPTAMSVKEGSMELLTKHFPDLANKPLTQISTDKSVRFLENEDNQLNKYYPVSDFIFVQYDPSADIDLRKLSALEGAKLLLEQTWVAPDFSSAEELFEKIDNSTFYQLNYSDNNGALNVINKLFENE